MARVHIFQDLRYYLNKLNLINDSPVLIGKIKVPDSILHFFNMLLMNITIIFLLRFCFESGFNLSEMSSAFGVALGVSQLAFVYVTLAANKDVIDETMNHIQAVVTERK